MQLSRLGGVDMAALDHQEGGDHYKTKAIQPVQYCMANGIGFMEGSVIKYVTRWQDKGGVQDLKKARHFLDLLIEYEEVNDTIKTQTPSPASFHG